MKKRNSNKYKRESKGNSVAQDTETFANTYVVTRPNGKVRDCPQSRVVTVTPGSKHGRYNTNGNVTATPLETDLDQVIIPRSTAFSKIKRVVARLGGEHFPR